MITANHHGKSGLIDVTDILKRTSLFSGLTGKDLEKVRAIGITKRYQKGESMFSEGQKATGFFVNLSGQVKIYKLSADGREQILHIITPGEAFAEAALFIGSTYPAFAEALNDVRVLYFPKETFVGLVRDNPQLSLNMIAGLSAFLRRFVDLVEELSLKDVTARLSSYLLDTSVRRGRDQEEGTVFDLEVSKTQLASRLGTISETLSRTFRKLQDMNVIRVEGKRITVVNRKSLEEIASGMLL